MNKKKITKALDLSFLFSVANYLLYLIVSAIRELVGQKYMFSINLIVVVIFNILFTISIYYWGFIELR